MMGTEQDVGLGSDDHTIAVYIANRPPLVEYTTLNQLTAVSCGEIAAIGQQCGNGWRKVFNVYAKLLYALDPQLFGFTALAPTWQKYRDAYLLKQGSNTTLLFSPPVLYNEHSTIHIIMGRTYAKTLVNSGQLDVPLTWLDNEFAINSSSRVIVCPYFDYRQLSNIKIERLAAMINDLSH